MATRQFKIIDGPLSVRSTPSLTGDRVGEIPVGTIIDVTETKTANNFIWWKHNSGWSAERRLDNFYIFMEEFVSSGNVDTTKSYFKIIDGPLSVRNSPSIGASKVGELATGLTISVDPDSRTEADDYVWWKHDVGWSAERNSAGTYILMTQTSAPDTDSGGSSSGSGGSTDSAGAGTSGDGGSTITQPDTQEPTDTEELIFRVLTNVSIRDTPSLSGNRKGQLAVGDIIKSTQKASVDGYVWRNHSSGWSAQKSQTDSNETYMERVKEEDYDPAKLVTLPDGSSFMPQILFTRTPLDFNKLQWVQYFGNSRFAYKIWSEGKRWYKYCQALHGGFDYGNSQAGTPIYAGVNGTVLQTHLNASVYSPNYLRVKIGNYLIVYGHIANAVNFPVGATITPNTVIGYIDAGGQNHLHLEVRYNTFWIINPFLVMDDSLIQPILTRFSTYRSHFYGDNGYSQWQDPFDQPVLRLSGTAPIGPHAG